MGEDTEDQTREYMISRAKTCLLSGDSCYAKSWIMTANALFPQNDKIKIESYEMSKCENNVEEAVKYLCEMFDTNQCQQQLSEEFNKIVISCRNEWQTYKLNDKQINSVFGSQAISLTQNSNHFYSKLFGSLSVEYQYKLLRRVADRTEDKLILIDLLLFILKKFPESVVENGLKLIEIMDENSISSESDSTLHLNQYLKKKLVFNVLPLIFAENSKLVLDFQTTQKLMERTLKYFVERLISTQEYNYEDMDESHIQNSSGCKETDDSLEMKVKEIFQLIGHKNDWKLFESIDFNNEKQLELIYDKISNFLNEFLFTGDTDSPIDLSSASTAKIKVDEHSNQQILYATLLLFLHCLRKYSKLISEFVLIEESNHTFNESKIVMSLNKKRKLVEPALITKSPELRLTFVIASKALKLLQENLTINSEFIRLSEIIGLNICQTYHSFVIDSNLFRAEYKEVMSLILNQRSINIKSNLQLISSALMLHDYNSTLKYCLDSIECLPHLKNNNRSDKDSEVREHSQESGVCPRRLIFVSLTVDDIISYIIEVIILCLKERVLFSLKPSDLGVGHLLVLSQYKWPNNLKLFLTCVSFIKCGTTKVHGSQSQPKFNYQNFFSYIFIPDIIEEFMSVVELGHILLELKPSTSTLGTPLKTSTKMMTTRGVNKGFKEENRSALIQQMKISKSQIPNQMFIEFINKEIRSFLTTTHK